MHSFTPVQLEILTRAQYIIVGLFIIVEIVLTKLDDGGEGEGE